MMMMTIILKGETIINVFGPACCHIKKVFREKVRQEDQKAKNLTDTEEACLIQTDKYTSCWDCNYSTHLHTLVINWPAMGTEHSMFTQWERENPQSMVPAMKNITIFIKYFLIYF